jgi:hypothetical protein
LSRLAKPEIHGYTASGQPVYAVSGGAPTVANVQNWIPIEYDSDVVQRVLMESAVERWARPYPMRTSTREIPRSAGMSVTADTTYTDDANTNDKVVLTARRFVARFSIDEDDLADANTRMDVIATKGIDWSISYADTFDNACLGVTAAESSTPANHKPFTSLYKTVRTADSGAGYSADANYLSWDGTTVRIPASPIGTSSYEKLSALYSLVETGKYWSPADMLVIANPAFRNSLRLTMDGNGEPIFKESAYIDSQTQRPVDTLFGTRIAWSRGCKTTSSGCTDSPDGNALLAYVNTRFLAKGNRSGPETLTDNARAQDDTDAYSVKFRTRRGFKVTHPKAVAVLEKLA